MKPTTQPPVLTDSEKLMGGETLIKFDVAALDFCARKIAAESGDTRKVTIEKSFDIFSKL